MGAIRTLYTDLKLRSTDALKGLVAYGKQWQAMDKIVANAATSIERNADRVAAALTRVAAGAANVRTVGVAPSTRTPRASAPRSTTRTDNAMARQAGLADGAKAIKDATAALGPLATKSDRAKASIADLAAQVARNRKEMADLRAEAVRTGDSEGTLKSRMQGLAVATGQASVALQKARGELRAVDGGLIDAVKNAGKLRERFGALQVAAGNLVSGAVSGAIRGIGGALVDSASSAIKFESEMANVAKVVDGLKTPTGEITAEYTAMEKKVLDLSTTIAGPGAAGFAKIYAAAGEAGIAKEDLNQFAESAAKVSVAFGVTAEEAGSGMAKMRSGLALSQDEVESLAGTMNHLSNNMAVTAKQAMEVVLASGGVGRAANVSGQEVAGLGAAMIAAGAQSDVAATASKNYILALSSGATATLRQRTAYKELGLEAEDVARRFTGTAKERLQVQQELLTKIGALSDDKRVSALSNLFGRESLGAISGITADVGKFTTAMTMATDATAAASSVTNEYNIRSKTTENAVALLKANVENLGIQFGQALLPHINKVVEFLTSPEGKEWGANAVEKAVGAVESFAGAIGFLIDTVSGLTSAFGGTTVAIAAVGVASLGLTGPFGAALLAGTAAGYGIAAGFKAASDAIFGTTKLIDAASKMRVDRTGEKLDAIRASEAEDRAASQQQGARQLAARKAGADLEAGVLQQAGVKSFSELDKATQASLATRQAKLNIAATEGRNFDEELSGLQAQTGNLGREYEGGGPGSASNQRARFDALSAKVRRGQKLKPSEAKEYTALSKSLDEAKASKAGKGKVHKQTKMDRQLAAIGGDVRGVLTTGGESDAGGDLKVHDDVLSRSVFDRATKGGAGGKDRSDGAGIGPGPNVFTTYQYVNTTVTVPIDARSSASPSDNIRNAANQAGQQLGGVVFTGATKLLQQKNAGGVMRSG